MKNVVGKVILTWFVRRPTRALERWDELSPVFLIGIKRFIRAWYSLTLNTLFPSLGQLRKITKAAFTRQTKVGKLVLANSSWCVWTAQKQSRNTLATVENCWRQIELVSILANFFTNFFVLVNSYLKCERLATCVDDCQPGNQNTRSKLSRSVRRFVCSV